MSNSNIKILSVTKEDVKKWIDSIARFRIEIFREYPFLYQGSYEYEKRYLAKYLKMENSIIVLAFHENELIGLATGYPFIYEEESLKRLFIDHHLDPKNYFCLGESVLKKDYRRQGIGHKFFDIREKHVKDLKIYPSICFYTVKREENDPNKPFDYFPLASFWKKRGYKEHLDLIGTIKWQEIGMTKEIPHKMVFWTKP